MIRIAILGAGEIAVRHVEGFQRTRDVKLVSICDPIAERATELAKSADFERVDAHADDAITADDIDLVLVLTPHDLHAPQVIAALEAGKHVICEKPMGRTVAECDAMLDAAERTGQQLFVTHVLRTMFFFSKAHERLAAGALGRLTLGSFRWYTDELFRLDDPSHWKGTVDVSGGGVLIDGGCHVSDVGNWLFGRARRVQAIGDKLVATREGVGEDTVVFQVEYESGALASYALSFVAGSGLRPRRFACGMDVDLYGTEGHIEGGYRFRDEEHLHYLTEHHRGEADHAHPVDTTNVYGDIDVAIVGALRGERPSPVTTVEARNAVAVVEAAYRSLASGATVDVDWRER